MRALLSPDVEVVTAPALVAAAGFAGASCRSGLAAPLDLMPLEVVYLANKSVFVSAELNFAIQDCAVGGNTLSRQLAQDSVAASLVGAGVEALSTQARCTVPRAGSGRSSPRDR